MLELYIFSAMLMAWPIAYPAIAIMSSTSKKEMELNRESYKNHQSLTIRMAAHFVYFLIDYRWQLGGMGLMIQALLLINRLTHINNGG